MKPSTSKQSSLASKLRLVGCAGWNVPSELRDTAYSVLEQYSAHFDCVEINSSFYRHHKPETYAKWSALVPPHFRFSVKCPKSITHERILRVETLRRFADEVRELGSKLGPILVQFPPSREFEERTAEELFESMRCLFPSEIVCEPRHRTWFTPSASKCLDTYAIHRVAADPRPNDAAPSIEESEPSRYYRLHGAPRIYYSAYPPARLDMLAERIGKTEGELWIVFDNTALGHAFHDAREMRRLLFTPDSPAARPLGPAAAEATFSDRSRHEQT